MRLLFDTSLGTLSSTGITLSYSGLLRRRQEGPILECNTRVNTNNQSIVVNDETKSSSRCTCETFKSSREVFDDNECYPPTANFPSTKVRKIRDSTLRAGIESITTQNWRSSYNYGFESGAAEPALMKSFENAIVYRKDQTTYVQNDRVWTASMRCLIGNISPVRADRKPVVRSKKLFCPRHRSG